MYPPPAAPSSNGWGAKPCQGERGCGENDGRHFWSSPLCQPRELAANSTRISNTTEKAMNLAELNKVAEAMVAPGRGILAADESSGTIKKRFDAIGAESTADSRRD